MEEEGVSTLRKRNVMPTTTVDIVTQEEPVETEPERIEPAPKALFATVLFLVFCAAFLGGIYVLARVGTDAPAVEVKTKTRVQMERISGLPHFESVGHFKKTAAKCRKTVPEERHTGVFSSYQNETHTVWADLANMDRVLEFDREKTDFLCASMVYPALYSTPCACKVSLANDTLFGVLDPHVLNASRGFAEIEEILPIVGGGVRIRKSVPLSVTVEFYPFERIRDRQILTLEGIDVVSFLHAVDFVNHVRDQAPP